MQAGVFFFFPAEAVEGGEAGEDFEAGGFGDGVAEVVVRGEIGDGVEGVAKVEAGPAVGVAHGFVDGALEAAHFSQFRIAFGGVVEAVVERRQANSAGGHDAPAEGVEGFAQFREARWEGGGKGKCFVAIGRRIIQSSFQC